MKNLFLYPMVGLFFLIFCACSKGSDLTVNSLTELEEKLKAEMEANDLTSIAYCIVKNDAIIHSSAMGFADKNNSKLATDSTRYLIASISKTITAVALMQLVEQGLIGLDDAINLHLPFEVKNPKFPGTNITFRMLLTHTSSISDDYQNSLNLDCYGGDCAMSLEEFFEDVFLENGTYFSPKNFSGKQPGKKEDYSNLASALAGYLVERISATPFDDYCKTHIFEPLGMSKTEWRLANTPLDELAIPYSTDITHDNPHYTFPDYPNGGLRSTVLDISKFLRMIMLNGSLNGVEILSTATVTDMKTLQFGSTTQCLSFYYENINDKSLLGHNGGEKGVSTEMFYDTDTNLGVVIFNNDDDADLSNCITLLLNYGALN